MSESNQTLTEQYYDNLRKKIVFHIRQLSPGFGDRITPKGFHHELLPKFPATAKESVVRLFWEMTTIDVTGRWVYHKLDPKWLGYDRPKELNASEI